MALAGRMMGVRIRSSAFVGRLITKIRLKFKKRNYFCCFWAHCGVLKSGCKEDAAYLNLYKHPYKLKIFIAPSVLFGC
ncbi:hypothetical protein CAMRE0001_2785 [Campylobacter rectus RM3267]|uniref:Uncharacterized protein n=1 Tax=Campylobacter rectus RM3267 TaxID=553218 RepID=B9D0X8_CAMRE|nr:hypothetical protein CAMRE0001_2785 [Campylobacter rectus RM3267]